MTARLLIFHTKEVFQEYIERCKDKIFNDGADAVMERLTQAAVAVGETLDTALKKLAKKVRKWTARFEFETYSRTRLKSICPFFGEIRAMILLKRT